MEPCYSPPVEAAPILSLYDICRRKIALILKRNLWDETPNPFPVLPKSVIHDLIHFTFSYFPQESFRAYFIEPLLMTGRVRQLTLQNINLDAELLPTLRSFTICRQLTKLNLLNVCEYNLSTIRGLTEEVLKAVKELEELHCSILFNLSAIQKCKKLRIAKLHFTPDGYIDNFLEEEDGRIQAHQNLSLFSLCGEHAENFPHFKEVAEILANCPKLRSLGYLDVSKAFGYLHGSETANIRTYGLESSCWREYKVVGWSQAEDDFLSCIRVAALACPLLRELVVKIPKRHYDGTLSVLHTLQNLTYLEIELDLYKKAFRPEIFHLLSEIGSNLQHLALHRIENIEFDAILKLCPQLVSLKIDCDNVIEDWAEPSVNPQQLLRLSFFCSQEYCGSNCLRLLLSKCGNLKELFLQNSAFLCDSFLSKVLKDNPRVFENLKIVWICDCSLTKDGLKKFLSYAKNLEKIWIESTKLSTDDTENLIRNINTEVIITTNYDCGLIDEFFIRRKYMCT